MRIWWALALCACTIEDPATMTTTPVPPIVEDTPLAPGACSGNEISLYGMTGSSEATKVPITAMPTTLCLALDGRDNIRIAHFAAGTPYQQASASSYKMALFGTDDALLREGWDVSFGNGNVFTNVEYGIPVGAVTHVKLVVDGAGTTEVALHLFEPYE